VPIDHHPRREDHGYRIDVSRDGSMIMAVPIVDDRGGEDSQQEEEEEDEEG
jgi:hypothetical protein